MLPFPQSTIANGCQVDTSDGPPGGGSRFYAPGEDFLSRTINRGPWALVQNDEYLDNLLTVEQKAYTEVAVLASVGGTSIAVDPSGGAGGDVNYTGTLYLGDATWAGAGRDQEFLDTLFQVLDEDYNEVMVDGVEAKVTSLTGNALGDEFVSTMTQLNLNVSLPTGNYRLAYGRGSDYESLPAYAFMRADVRGLQESAGESGKHAFYVLDPNASPNFPADYKGATCLQDAIDDLGGSGPVYLYLRAGTYTVHQTGAPGTQLTISDPDITIIGEGRNQTILSLQSGHDLIINTAGDRVQLQDLQITSASTTQNVEVAGQGCRFSNVDIDKLGLRVYEASPSRVAMLFDRVNVGGGPGLAVEYASYVQFSNCYFQQSSGSGQPAGWLFNSAEKIVFDNCIFLANGSTTNRALDITGGCSDITIRNCKMTASGGGISVSIENCTAVDFLNCELGNTGAVNALLYGDTSGVYLVSASFKNCHFHSDEAVIGRSALGAPQMARLSFEDCKFENTASVAWGGAATQPSPFQFESITGTSIDVGITLKNCHFYDRHFNGLGGIGPSARTALIFKGCTAHKITFDRRSPTSFWENGAYVSIEDSLVEDLSLYISCDDTPDTTDTGDGMITVLADGTLKNLTVDGVEDEWAWPLLYLEGDSTDRKMAVVDGVNLVIGALSSGTWWFPAASTQGLAATLNGHAILRSFDFNSTLLGDTTTGSQAIVHVEGSTCYVEDCEFFPSTGKYLYIIRVHGGDTFDVHIQRNKIYWLDGSPWSRNGVAAIYVYGGSGSESRNGWIQNNRIQWLTDMSEDTDHPGDVHKVILLWDYVYTWTVSENYILTETQAGAGGEFVICIQEGVYGGAATVPAGGNNVTANIVQDFGNIAIPDIGDVGTPSVAQVTAGDATNTLIRGGA